MLKKCTEDDFQELKWVSDSRLTPDAASPAILASLIFNGLMFFVSFAAIASTFIGVMDHGDQLL